MFILTKLNFINPLNTLKKMNETTTIALSAIIFTIVLLSSVMVSLSLLRTNTELEEKLTELEKLNRNQDLKIDAQRKEISFQTSLNKTLSEGLEAFTKKYKK